jgi:hypothetical protein
MKLTKSKLKQLIEEALRKVAPNSAREMGHIPVTEVANMYIRASGYFTVDVMLKNGIDTNVSGQLDPNSLGELQEILEETP